MSQEPSFRSEPPPGERATRWLSHGFETLVASLQGDPERTPQTVDFDVVIVGTGYGGAVAAAELAKTRGNRRICVLERGSEHLPGSFPSRMAELPGHVRFSTKNSHHPRGRREALFDVRIGEDLCALVANGVGGGSLINAGVMAFPKQDVFRSARWPTIFHQQSTVEALFELAAGLKQRLGATQTVKSVNQPEPLKYTALGKIRGGSKVEPLPITAALGNAADQRFQTAADVGIDACVRCGNCATGCNHNAKISLDVTLLAEARQHGAEVVSGATVLKIERLTGLAPQPVWQLHVVYTDEPLRRRQGRPTLIRARRVVLAAGTFGSTEILLRSRGENLRFSDKLGQQVSSNGDLIAAAYGGSEAANCVADEDADARAVPAAQQVGPTITGMIDLRGTGDEMVIQDLAVPGSLRPVLEQSVATASAIHMLAESDGQRHGPQTRDACAVDAQAIRNTLLVAIIGHDSAEGVMKLNSSDDWDCGDGATTIQWPALKDYPPLLARHRRFERLLADSGTGARALPNPMWRLLPEKLGDLLGSGTGPLLTVHPLGGCPMGDDMSAGVVDDCGRVFDGSAKGQYHEGLVVLDGSIVPASLGINPALAIASLALRAIGRLRIDWGYVAPGSYMDIGNRPYFKRPGAIEPPQETLIEVTERLSGPVAIDGMARAGHPHSHVELTLRFDPISIRQLTSGTDAATLGLQASHGRLRIFTARPPEDVEAADDEALLVASVKGTLRAFGQKPSTPMGRRWHGFWAWLRNRGLKDTVLWVIDRCKGEGPGQAGGRSVWEEAIDRSKRLWALSSRAGAVRLLEYDLEIDSVLHSNVPADLRDAFPGASIKGEKQLTYSRRANPWRQLMEVSLNAFPRARRSGAVLALDVGYLARQRVPLFRVVRQQDQVKALLDVASLGLYLLRMLIHIHSWSFRLPDEPLPREIERLPDYVPGLPPPEIHEFEVDQPRDGKPVRVRLTRYRYSRAKRARAVKGTPDAREAIETPILLIHGYSTSGTAFAHHAVRPNVASALWERGRDVWIADLRTSSGMPHAKVEWTFEQVGTADIPVAVHQVCVLTGAGKIDVFAHCMGSAMLGMALLGSESARERFPELRRELPNRIRRLVMSQVAPAVVFTPANTLRAYAMQYLRHFFPLQDYEFRPSGQTTQADHMIDRILATLPYPEDEFDLENPLWPPWRRTPWVGTRHRMDALYGRDFNARNLPAGVLDYIDDHFGPLSIETVSQAIHFARLRTITDRQGFNDYVRPDRLREKLQFPVLHVHGKYNGLVSKRTPEHFHAVLADCDPGFESPRAFLPTLHNAGHQDLLIGRPAAAMMKQVNAYLENPFNGPDEGPSQARVAFTAQVPSHGVRVPSPLTGSERCSLADEGATGTAVAALLIPVVEKNGRYLAAQETGEPVELTPGYLGINAQWRALAPVAPGETRTRFTFDLAGFAPAGATCGILTLVLYSQSAGIAAPPTDAGRSVHALAMHVATRAKGGKGLAGLARIVADPNDSGPSIGRLVEEMALAVGRAFERTDDTELGLGILRPPQRRGPCEPPPSTLTFALASCQYPAGLLDGTPPCATGDGPPGPSDASCLRLLAWLEGRRSQESTALPVPGFLVLMGDQVYADATAGLFDPRRIDDRHRVCYEAFFGARGARAVLSRLPAVMRLDDHEIDDNWEPDPPGCHPMKRRRDERRKGIRPGYNESLMKKGVQEFLRNQCDQDCNPSPPPRLWHRTPVAGFEFFWADARTARTPRTAATIASASLLGESQSVELDRWLADRRVGGPRFFVSGPMVLPRHLAMRRASLATAVRSDAWDGYPASLHRLLAGVYQRGADDVVFLSGNEHVSNVATFQICKLGAPDVVVAHSVHSSALYAPYAFANGSKEDFAGTEEFEFSHAGVMYRCKVSTWYPPRGDGFAVLAVSPDGAGWRVSVRFDREQQDPADPLNMTEFRIAPSTISRAPPQLRPARPAPRRGSQAQGRDAERRKRA